VTVLCQGRRLDLLLPAAMACGELVPMLLRLLVRDPALERVGGDRNQAAGSAPTEVAVEVVELVAWQLVRVGGAPLSYSQTLGAAGVLDGDVVELRHAAEPRPVVVPGTARDRVEDLVHYRARFWTDRTSRAFANSVALTVAAGLIVPVSQLPLGFAVAGLAGALAVALMALAARMSRRSATVCANLALLIGCAWGFLAGASAYLCQVADQAGSTRTSAMVLAEMVGLSRAASGGANNAAAAIAAAAAGVGAAVLLVSCSLAHQPSAVGFLTALTLVGCSLLVLVIAGVLGLPTTHAANVVAVSAVLAMGGLPRVALLVGGLTNARLPDDPTAFDPRFVRSDGVLTGSIVGVSLVAGVVALVSAATGDRLQQLFAAALGLTLILRSRGFSQVPHAIGPRIAGLLVVVALWATTYRGASHLGQGLLLVVATGGAALAVVSAGRAPSRSLVGRARASRLMNVTEQLSVVLLVILAAGIGGLFAWTAQVLR
jgi:hypothetical protein